MQSQKKQIAYLLRSRGWDIVLSAAAILLLWPLFLAISPQTDPNSPGAKLCFKPSAAMGGMNGG